MSVTVSDLLKLPSLQHARVIGGAGGLKKVVSSISVLESTDPGVLINEVFRHNKTPAVRSSLPAFLTASMMWSASAPICCGSLRAGKWGWCCIMWASTSPGWTGD